jgi:cytoskeletal protein CcmA (bactofilin family)
VYKLDENYVRSFKDSPQVLFSSERLVLSNNKIVGHYLVVSNKMIEVEASSKLTDVILIAPKIVIRDNVEGTFQAVASEHIEVGNNCQLNYPSSLALVNVNRKKMPNEASQIFIGKNSKIKGPVLYVETIEETSFLPNIFISEEAIIYGELYCENNLDLRGTVYGSVVTSNFIAAYGGSVYQNHLFNGKILSNELPQEYVGLSYSGNNNGIVKWLY